MIDKKVLERKGYTSDAWKKKFLSDKPSEKLQRFIDLTNSRIHEGYNRSIREARHYWAIDEAYDAVQRQISYTMVKGLLETKPSSHEIQKIADDWGLTSMLSPMINEKGQPVVDATGKQVMGLDLPTFFNIFVPVVLSYTKARAARIFSMRNQWPLYKYEPSNPSSQNRLRGRIATSRIQMMATQMGYAEDERQAILQTLMYGHCLAFPMEAYFTEKGFHMDDLGQEEEVPLREGVRFAMPHPSRYFFDMASRLSSLNFGTGVSYAGYWDDYRWGDVCLNKAYWLKKEGELGVVKGSMDWVDWASYGVYRKLYPCVMTMPSSIYGGKFGSTLDRNAEAFRYNMNTYDDGVTLATMFQKVVPSDYDLLDYDEPIWVQTVNALAETMIYAEPFTYDPVVAYQYDPDQNRYRSPSLAYELIPWQDHLGNLLAQYVISVKRNLTNVVMFNKEGVPTELVEKLQNLGRRAYTDLNFYGVSPLEQQWAGVKSSGELFQSVNFPQANTQEHLVAFNLLIQTMERALGFTAQEVGAPASHQQSATEVTTVQNLASTRVENTNSCLDPAFQKKKRVLYDAMMSHGSDEVMTEVLDMTQTELEAAEELGFTVQLGPDGTAGIIGSKTDLSLEFWASDREGSNRLMDEKVAASALQLFQAIFSNQQFMQLYGTERTMRALNRILEYAGVPKELHFPVNEAVANQEVLQQRMTEIANNVTADQMGQLGSELSKRFPQMAARGGNGAPAPAGAGPVSVPVPPEAPGIPAVPLPTGPRPSALPPIP